MTKPQTKNILICPLHWGTGHAARVQPVADTLIKKGHNVYIAAAEPLLAIYDQEKYSGLIPFNSIAILYSKTLPQYLAILIQLPLILISSLSDRVKIARLIHRYNIDIIISDNRFAAWSPNIYTVYITHQLTIALPQAMKFAESFVSFFHYLIIKKYNECWIPDIPGENNLSGRLSSKSNPPANSKSIGILSRMNNCEARKPELFPDETFNTVILSGPEPQRTVLEKIILAKAEHHSGRLLLLTAKSDGKKARYINDNITVYSYLEPGEVKYIILNSKSIICRSGYSTIMDLVSLGRSALLIPTPGQTEQEYLAAHLSEKGYFKTISQRELKESTHLFPQIPAETIEFEIGADLLDKAVNEMIITSSSQTRM